MPFPVETARKMLADGLSGYPLKMKPSAYGDRLAIELVDKDGHHLSGTYNLHTIYNSEMMAMIVNRVRLQLGLNAS
jgi:hypothetical protein